MKPNEEQKISHIYIFPQIKSMLFNAQKHDKSKDVNCIDCLHQLTTGTSTKYYIGYYTSTQMDTLYELTF